MELTDRKKEILKVVIEHYISTAEPVGSKTIAQEMTQKISSATIRNELADLVEMGYLEQPHTSAGRVPSPKGYRLYVNELMEQRALSLQETEEINSALQMKMQELDNVIKGAYATCDGFTIELGDLPGKFRPTDALLASTGQDPAPQGAGSNNHMAEVARALGWEESIPMKERLERVEYAMIQDAYDHFQSVRKAASCLGMSLATFVRKRSMYSEKYG